jgi:hypothetical protein
MKKTIIYKGFDLDVEFDYTPEEPMVMYYPDGSGYPGCAAEVDILEILLCDIDIYNLLEYKQLREIEDLILEDINQ